MAIKSALITGITGQDGSYLADFLLEKGYEVHGLVRRSSSSNTSRIDHLNFDSNDPEAELQIHYGDLTDASSLRRVLEKSEPDEIYNLAAQSDVRLSFDLPINTADSVALGPLKLLETVHEYQQGCGKQVRIYQASSSEMFGQVQEIPQSETTPFHPRSPYGFSKVFAYWAMVNYRESYGMHASNGIMFNHESPRRGENFVTRKITRAVGRIKYGLQEKLSLGNLEAKRDWGFAGDYVEAMWLMLQQEDPDDFVIATGETHSVLEFLELAFECVELDYREYVEVDSRFFRPAEVDFLLGDSTKAREQLGWEPRVNFSELVRLMVEADLEAAGREKRLYEVEGYEPSLQIFKTA